MTTLAGTLRAAACRRNTTDERPLRQRIYQRRTGLFDRAIWLFSCPAASGRLSRKPFPKGRQRAARAAAGTDPPMPAPRAAPRQRGGVRRSGETMESAVSDFVAPPLQPGEQIAAILGV